MKVFIAASGTAWFVQHCWAFIGSRVSLCRLTSLTEIFASCAGRFARCYISLSCHCRTLLVFTCSDDSCVSLSCTRAAIPTIMNFVIRTVFLVRPSRGQRARLDSHMCALIDRSTRLVETYCSVSLVHQALLAPFRRLPLTTLSRESCLCTWRLTRLWTDVWIFFHLCIRGTCHSISLSMYCSSRISTCLAN